MSPPLAPKHPRVEIVPRTSLKPNPNNPRKHSKKQLTQIANSIERFGFLVPIVSDDDSLILAGHGRWEAAGLLGLSEVPTIRARFLSETDRRAFALAENRIAELSAWDEDLLAAELEHLFAQDYDLEITGFDLSDLDTPALEEPTQMLFSQFRERSLAEQTLTSLTFIEELAIKTAWLKIIHSELYAGLDRQTREEKLTNHPYLNAFLPIIKESQLTVTYNFDDSLELMLALARTPDEKLRTRGYEVIDSPSLQYRHPRGVIYHPNGYLPAGFSDGASTDVVFSDDSFQDQLLTATTGGYLHLTNHLTGNTCLLVGLSLEDSTLQSMLRQNAVRNPGHIHYAVHFLPDSATRDKEAERAIFTANFESFGVYTLFLTSKQIRALAELIRMDETSFSSLYAKHKPKYVYYVIGAVGAGKSTAAANFRSLLTYDEWVDERLPELARPEIEVSADKVDSMNEWIAEQFRKKNFALHGCDEGIHVIDRAPLDPLTFGPEAERSKKAQALIDTITDVGTRPIVAGHIIELKATVEELHIRTRRKHKQWPEQELARLLYEIDQVYGPVKRSTVCTSGRNAAAVAKEIARIIFLGAYEPIDIQAELAKHAGPADA